MLVLLGTAACSGDDDSGASSDPSPAGSSAPTGTPSDDGTVAGGGGDDVSPAVCDVLTEPLATSVDPTIDRQGFSGPDQCAWSGRKSGTVLLLTKTSLDQAGAEDEDAFFTETAEQIGGTPEDVEVGTRGAVARDPEGGAIQVLWTDSTTYWVLLATFTNGDDDAKADAMVQVAQAIASAR